MTAHLAERHQTGLAGRRIDVLERRIGLIEGMLEHRGFAEVLAEFEPAGGTAARSHDTVGSNQRDRGGVAEIDPIVEVGEVGRIERGHHDAAELPLLVEEAARQLHRPLLADATDHRLGDEQAVFRAVEVDAIVLAVAQVDRGCGLRTGIGGPHDALGIDDRDLDDDLAQQVGGVDDRVVVIGVLPSLDGAAQIEQRLVDLADRAQHVLLERHCEILVGPLRHRAGRRGRPGRISRRCRPTAWR